MDTDRLEVRRAGQPVAIEPKAFDLLVLLIANRERVVTRAEIIDKLWSGRAITDDALSSCEQAVRRALGDDGRAQRLVRTEHRRGFRFVGDVVERESSAVAASAAGEDDPLAALPDAGLTPPGEPSIAVLPFEILSAVDGAGIVADGIVQDILTRLGRARRFFVIGRGTVFALRRQPHDPREVGRRLGVRYVLSGSLRHDGKRIRLSVALADSSGSFDVWADSFDRDIGDVLALQDEVAELVANRVQSHIEEVERRKALQRPIAHLDAWSAYYRACWHLDRHTPQDYDQAEALLKLAAKADPGSARVFAGLSFVHRQRAFLDLTRDRASEVDRALELASHSLSLEPQDPQAHWAYGRALMLRAEVEAALESFEVATSLNPSFAIGQYSVGFARAMTGRTAPSDEALTRARRLSPIDPMRFAMLATHAFNGAIAGDYARAAELAQRAAAHPNAHFHIIAIAALCSALAGQGAVAQTHAGRLRRLRSRYRGRDFFSAFPFQAAAHIATFRKGFDLLGLPH